MNTTIKEEVLQELKGQLSFDCFKYLAVKMQIEGYDNYEYSITHKENFDKKIHYIEECFDENLVSKSNPSVKIISTHPFYEIEDFMGYAGITSTDYYTNN